MATDDLLDLAETDLECLRCAWTRPMRFPGLCPECRDELRHRFERESRAVEVAPYEPKMNVTPNAVALKDS
jgi:hypothetical protein